MICTLSGIAVEPPQTTAITQKKVGGVVITEIKGGLRELKVVQSGMVGYRASSDFTIKLSPGDIIFVTSVSVANFPWAKEVFEVDGQSFIIVPVEFVVGYRK